MFVTLNMASLASSSLIVGYHQDVSLGAHILSMEGTYLPVPLWEEMARIVYENRWKEKYPTYEDWFDQFSQRIENSRIDIYSGRSLYSTLLPEDMNWGMKGAKIQNGIYLYGLLDTKIASGSSGSIGMVMYRTYGPKETVSWLNASYRMLNRYLIARGITLGIDQLFLSRDQRDRIAEIKQSVLERSDLSEDTDLIANPVLRGRKEASISQELDNVRETISVEVMNPKGIDNTLSIRGKITGTLTLYKIPYDIIPDCSMSRENPSFCIEQSKDPMNTLRNIERGSITPVQEDGYDQKITIRLSGENMISINLYTGSLLWSITSPNGQKRDVVLSMGIFKRVQFTLVTEEGNIKVDRTYDPPSPLRMMIESGARGNSTNAIQIAGIIGQQTYGGERNPRMLDSSCTPDVTEEEIDSLAYEEGVGPRSMPCYPFGTNTPESRGFISSSYLEGMNTPEYFAAHIASRENLAANTDLTPTTGYYSRRIRTFTENLRISKLGGKNVVVNERGVIVMMDYLLDPSRVFSVGGRPTFVDIGYEIQNIPTYIRGTYDQTRAVVLSIPYKKRMSDFIPIENRILQVLLEPSIQGKDVIITMDTRIERKYPDFASYVRDILPEKIQEEQKKNVGVQRQTVTPRGRGRGGRQQRVAPRVGTGVSNIVVFSPRYPGDFVSYTEYDSLLIIPVGNKNLQTNTLPNIMQKEIPQGISAVMNIGVKALPEISYPSRPDTIIPMNTLYSMYTYGTNFTQSPYLVRTSQEAVNLVREHSLLEMLMILGDISTL